MRRQIASQLRRAASALWTTMLLAWLALLLAIAIALLIAVIALTAGAYYVFGWWGVAVVALAVIFVCFRKDQPTEATDQGEGFIPKDDPIPWYMQSQYRFHHGPTNHHRGDW